MRIVQTAPRYVLYRPLGNLLLFNMEVGRPSPSKLGLAEGFTSCTAAPTGAPKPCGWWLGTAAIYVLDQRAETIPHQHSFLLAESHDP